MIFVFLFLTYSVGQTLGFTTSLQMAQFRSFYGAAIFHMWHIWATSLSSPSVDGHLGCFHVLL